MGSRFRAETLADVLVFITEIVELHLSTGGATFHFSKMFQRTDAAVDRDQPNTFRAVVFYELIETCFVSTSAWTLVAEEGNNNEFVVFVFCGTV